MKRHIHGISKSGQDSQTLVIGVAAIHLSPAIASIEAQQVFEVLQWLPPETLAALEELMARNRVMRACDAACERVIVEPVLT